MARLTRSMARRAAAVPVPRSRDRSTPRVGRLTPSAARRYVAGTSNIRPATLKSRFRAARPARVAKRLGAATRGGTVSGGTLVVWVQFSPPKPAEKRVIPTRFIGTDIRDRWASIQAGRLPADEDTPRAPTEEHVTETVTTAYREFETRGRRDEDRIREDHEHRRATLERQADEFDHAAQTVENARQAAQLHRRATHTREQIIEDARVAQRQLDDVADRVRQQRADFCTELEREVQQKKNAETERIAELQRNLDHEVANTINTHYFGGAGFDIESWELSVV